MNILITGASSGIGRELAISYSSNENNLFLCSRNLIKLDDVKKICEAKGSAVFIQKIDVKNKVSIKNFIDEIEEKYPINLLIANAGISAGTADGIESDEQIDEIFSTNLNGVLNTINPAIARMKQRKSGQIAIISSLAGFRGLPSSPAYCASKSAVRVYGEALRGNLAKYNIKINVICPGYIRTAMTDVNDFYMPFLMSAKKCAKIIKSGIEKNKSRIAFPFFLYFEVWLLALLPTQFTDKFLAKLPSKKSL
jgi:short-subunit dehydrogenase